MTTPSLDDFCAHGLAGGSILTLSTSGDPDSALLWLLPALAKVCHTNRWITWVAPPWIPRKPWLTRRGFNMGHTRVVHPRRRTRDRRGYGVSLLIHALGSRTNALVLGWPAMIDNDDLQRLHTAAKQGDTNAILFLPNKSNSQRQVESPQQLELAPLAGESRESAHNPAGRDSVGATIT